MSEKVQNLPKKQNYKRIFKWVGAVLLIALLECGGIFAAVQIGEYKNQAKQKEIQNLRTSLENQYQKINSLDKFSADITENTQRIVQLSDIVTLLGTNITNIKEYLAANDVVRLQQRVDTLDHKVKVLEETQNREALALAVTLIIKENALYHRPFAKEVDILQKLKAAPSEQVNTLVELKDTAIPSDDQLITSYREIAQNFSFKSAQPNKDKSKDRNTVSKSIDMIKDTVAGINFEKVIVLKKDKKTDEQKLLLTTLESLVEAHNFAEALRFIEHNAPLVAVSNQAFEDWQQQVRTKIRFDEAVSNIIASELGALKEDIAQDKTILPNMSTEELVND
jgi:hypothetical protein